VRGDPRSETALGVALALLSAASYGTMPVLAHVAYDSGADTLTFLAWRFVLAAVVIWPVVLLRRRPLPRGRLAVKVFVLGGVVYVGQALTYFAAVRYGDVTVIAPVVYTYPLFVVVLAALTRTEALTRTKLAAVAIGVVGAILTVGGSGQAQALGIILAVAAGLIFSFYFFLSDRLVSPGLAEGSTAVIISAAAVVFTALSLAEGHPHAPGTAGGWAATAGIALATVVGILFFLEGLRRLRPVATAVVSAAEPVVSVLLSVAILGETVGLTQGLGLVMVIGAVLLACRPPAGQPPLTPVPPG
jgi:drug/metabolite transporter (DMT)-like permease